MREMTIASLGAALRGIPRHSVILVETPDGLRRVVEVTTAMVNGALGEDDRDGSAAIVLRLE